MADTFEQLRSEFLAETEDTLHNLQQDLNELAEGIDEPSLPESVLDRVFRTTHSLKGVAGMFGLDQMSAVAHSMENILDELRRRRVTLDAELVDLLHRGNETLHTLLAAGSSGPEGDADGAAPAVIADTAEALIKRTPILTAETDAVGTVFRRLDPEEQENARQAAAAGRSVVSVEASLPTEGFETPFRDLLKVIRSWGTVHGTVSDDPDATTGRFRVHLLASGSDEVFALMKGVGPLDGRVLLPSDSRWLMPATESDGQNGAIVAPVATEEATSPRFPERIVSLRVPVDRVDRLMSQLGDLIQAKMTLDETAQGLLVAPGRTSPPLLRQSLRSLDRHIRALQEGILGVRLVALGPLFQKLERTFREACRITGKEARLHTEGEHLELDKGVVEPLSEAMIHLVRNAVDHGLETLDRREVSGKNRVGEVRISARAEGSFTILEVADDGGGIPLGRVRERAEQCGWVAPGTDLSRGELVDMLFRPGFTLKDTTTEISGRGVGLDAVRDAVVRIGGTVDIMESEVGTTFRIRVPISLAVTQALEVEAGGQAYFLPLSHVLRVFRLGDPSIVSHREVEGVDGTGATPRVHSLQQLLEPDAKESAERVGSAVLLALADRRMLLRVDRVGRRREIVVRSLGPLLASVPAVSGCTELGDGRTVLILDPIALFAAPSRGPVGAAP